MQSRDYLEKNGLEEEANMGLCCVAVVEKGFQGRQDVLSKWVKQPEMTSASLGGKCDCDKEPARKPANTIPKCEERALNCVLTPACAQVPC